MAGLLSAYEILQMCMFQHKAMWTIFSLDTGISNRIVLYIFLYKALFDFFSCFPYFMPWQPYDSLLFKEKFWC